MADPLPWYLRLVLHYAGRGPYLVVGDGRLLARLAEHGPASGLAASEEEAAEIRAAAPGCPVHVGGGAVPSGTFQGVIAIDRLAWSPDPAADLAQWFRALRPGGRAIVLVPDPEGRGRRLAGERWTGDRPGNRAHDEWRRVLLDAGFTVHREGSDGLCRGPYNRVPTLLDPRTSPARTQRRLGTLFLNPGEGENSVFVLEKPEQPEQ